MRPDAGRILQVMRQRVPAAIAGLASVAICTGVVAVITPAVPGRATGVVYLIGVLVVSSAFGLTAGLATGAVSVLALNFLFIAPNHSLAVAHSGEWLSLAAFAVAAVIGSELAARARRRAVEAAQRAREAELGERLATLIAAGADLEHALPAVALQAARALGAEEGVIHLESVAPPQRAGQTLALEVAGARVGELRLIACPRGALDTPAAARIGRIVASLILLARERDRHVAERVDAEALRRSNALKTVLLRAVSHDLRSPLMAIMAAAGALSLEHPSGADGELVQTVLEQSERMDRLVSDLLDLSRMQGGVLSPARDWCDPADIAGAAVAGDARNRDPKRVRLEVARGVPLVRVDPRQIERVIANLVSNAVKFSPASTPVEVRVTAASGHVEVTVTDHGPGIPADLRERIFEPFQRLAAAAPTPGSGLGLAIARGLAEANGCRLDVSPAPGGGSVFTLSIPISQAGAGLKLVAS